MLRRNSGHMTRPRNSYYLWTVALLACLGLLRSSVSADPTGTWAGTVQHVNASDITVHAHSQTQQFVIPPGFDNVRSSSGKKKLPFSSIKPGVFVTVTYTHTTLFGTKRVIEIDVGNGFNLTMPAFAPKPHPTASGPP